MSPWTTRPRRYTNIRRFLREIRFIFIIYLQGEQISSAMDPSKCGGIGQFGYRSLLMTPTIFSRNIYSFKNNNEKNIKGHLNTTTKNPYSYSCVMRPNDINKTHELLTFSSLNPSEILSCNLISSKPPTKPLQKPYTVAFLLAVFPPSFLPPSPPTITNSRKMSFGLCKFRKF